MNTITDYDTAMKYIEEMPAKSLAKLTPDQLGEIQRKINDPDQFHDFRFRKNLKIFGTPDRYIADIFRKKTIETVLSMPDDTPMQQRFKSASISDLILTLDKLIHRGISEKNKKRLDKILQGKRDGSTHSPTVVGAKTRKNKTQIKRHKRDTGSSTSKNYYNGVRR
jgi:hypothetical protein